MKTLIKILTGTFIWLFLCALIFLAIAFYKYELDPNLWTSTERGIFGILCITSFLTNISFLFLNDKKQ